MVIEGREADHDDRYRTGERSRLLSNFTALEPTKQRVGLAARIFEYRVPLDEIVEVARRLSSARPHGCRPAYSSDR